MSIAGYLAQLSALHDKSVDVRLGYGSRCPSSPLNQQTLGLFFIVTDRSLERIEGVKLHLLP